MSQTDITGEHVTYTCIQNSRQSVERWDRRTHIYTNTLKKRRSWNINRDQSGSFCKPQKCAHGMRIPWSLTKQISVNWRIMMSDLLNDLGFILYLMSNPAERGQRPGREQNHGADRTRLEAHVTNCNRDDREQAATVKWVFNLSFLCRKWYKRWATVMCQSTQITLSS